MKTKVLITGGAGYIGSHVSYLLDQNNIDHLVIDNFSTGSREALLKSPYLECDLNQTDKLNEIFARERFTAVMHFAGSIVVPESVQDPMTYYQNNSVNSLNLMKLCCDHGVHHFIFSSTAAVYGIPESSHASEESAVNPINPYGRSKLLTEWQLEDLSKAVPEFKHVALRYFNVAGANLENKIGQSTPNATHLIKIACETAVGKRESMSLFGDDYNTPDGSCIRDYIHVEDLAMAHLNALQYLERGGESCTLNCGYGRGLSVKEVIESVKRVTGVDIKVEKAPRREGDSPELVSKAEKIQKILGWKPKHNQIDVIVKTAYEWEKKLAQKS